MAVVHRRNLGLISRAHPLSLSAQVGSFLLPLFYTPLGKRSISCLLRHD